MRAPEIGASRDIGALPRPTINKQQSSRALAAPAAWRSAASTSRCVCERRVVTCAGARVQRPCKHPGKGGGRHCWCGRLGPAPRRPSVRSWPPPVTSARRCSSRRRRWSSCVGRTWTAPRCLRQVGAPPPSAPASSHCTSGRPFGGGGAGTTSAQDIQQPGAAGGHAHAWAAVACRMHGMQPCSADLHVPCPSCGSYMHLIKGPASAPRPMHCSLPLAVLRCIGGRLGAATQQQLSAAHRPRLPTHPSFLCPLLQGQPPPRTHHLRRCWCRPTRPAGRPGGRSYRGVPAANSSSRRSSRPGRHTSRLMELLT